MIRRSQAATASIIALALAACGEGTKEPKTAEEVIAEAGEMQRPDPGQYETKVELVEFAVPGLPPEQAEKLKAMMGNVGAQSSSFCLTAEEAGKGFEEQVRKMGQGQGGLECEYDEFDVNGGKLAAAMTCKGPQGMGATMKIDGTTTSRSTSMTMDMSQKSAMIPGGEMKMKMKMDSKRTGDC
jgi:hypothetical protein